MYSGITATWCPVAKTFLTCVLKDLACGQNGSCVDYMVLLYAIVTVDTFSFG